MMVKSGNFVGFGGIFNVFEVAKAYIFAVNSYASAIRSVLGFANTFVSAGVVRWPSSVVSILAFGSKPQIFNPAVIAIHVNMVNKLFRKFIVVVSPNQAVHLKRLPKQTDVSVPVFVNITSDATGLGSVRSWVFPKKVAISVFKDVAHNFGRDKICFVHAVVPFKRWFGKWRLGVDSIGPLRYCTKGAV
jgi:hypothetical protein